MRIRPHRQLAAPTHRNGGYLPPERRPPTTGGIYAPKRWVPAARTMASRHRGRSLGHEREGQREVALAVGPPVGELEAGGGQLRFDAVAPELGADLGVQLLARGELD